MLILHLSIVLFLIIVNSVFAMAEIALVSARKARLVPAAEAGNRGAPAALELKADPSRLPTWRSDYERDDRESEIMLEMLRDRRRLAIPADLSIPEFLKR